MIKQVMAHLQHTDKISEKFNEYFVNSIIELNPIAMKMINPHFKFDLINVEQVNEALKFLTKTKLIKLTF